MASTAPRNSPGRPLWQAASGSCRCGLPRARLHDPRTDPCRCSSTRSAVVRTREPTKCRLRHRSLRLGRRLSRSSELPELPLRRPLDRQRLEHVEIQQRTVEPAARNRRSPDRRSPRPRLRRTRPRAGARRSTRSAPSRTGPEETSSRLGSAARSNSRPPPASISQPSAADGDRATPCSSRRCRMDPRPWNLSSTP